LLGRLSDHSNKQHCQHRARYHRQNSTTTSIIDIAVMETVENPVTLGVIFSALCAVIGTLWKVLNTQSINVEKRLTTKLDECEKKHEDVTNTLLKMSAEVGELRGRQEGVNSLAEQVLAVVAETKTRPSRTKKITPNEPNT
jgi:hypothetical protein